MSALRPLPVVVGTAGHIDHGKSALIEALTGTHPDRWREEQERGITLDLGYAQLDLGDGTELGFVDVPGHERLVRKMVAGATGMGLAMLVVACDDGVMPQTREHFEVLSLLGVEHGLVVLSKADLVDEEMQALVRADVEELLAGTPWEGCPVVTASAVTGAGIEELRGLLTGLAAVARRAPDARAAFRLPVQRSFAMPGAGTVVTGICSGGAVVGGDQVVVMPSGLRSRVRKVQVHGREAEEVAAGLRTALNLPEVGPAACPRGAVVAAVGSLAAGTLVRARVKPLPGAPPLEHGATVQVLAHTAAVAARVFFLAGTEGEDERFVDLELAQPMALVPGERLLLRRPSPARNQGVGRFLLFSRRRLRRKDRSEREALLRFAAALDDPDLLAARALEVGAGGPQRPEEVAALLGWTREAAGEALEAACERGEARRMTGDRFVGAGRAGALAREITGVVDLFRKENPHRLRIPVALLRTRLGKAKAKMLEEMPDADLEALGLRRRRGLEWQLTEADVAPELAALGEGLLQNLRAGGLAPPDFASLAASLGVDPGRVGEVAAYLCDAGHAIRAGDELVFALEPVEELRRAVVEQFSAGGVNIPALRDRFQTTRKYLMPLLEYLDACGVTVRRGPNRILKDPEAALA